AFGLEARRGFEKPDMALLDQVARRQAEMAELARHRDDEAHVGDGYPVERLLVMPLFPAQRQFLLLLSGEIGRLHRLADHASLRRLVHLSLPILRRRG